MTVERQPSGAGATVASAASSRTALAFAVGDRVRVKAEERQGHMRTPAYVRGKLGWVQRVHGEFRDPEKLAYGGDGFPRQALYLVGFRQTDLWHDRYAESARDNLYVDLYEHWLEPVEEGTQP